MPPPTTQGWSSIGSGVGAIGAGIGSFFQAEGVGIEQQRYVEAALFAGQEAQYERMSTAIQSTQAERETLLGQGRVSAEVAGAGFTEGGSALDILRSGAEQGALHSQVLEQQGLITTQGYLEQQQSYELMAQAAGVAKKADTIAGYVDLAAGAISLGAGAISLGTGR